MTKSKVTFKSDPISGWMFAFLPDSILTLVRFTDGYVYIGRPFAVDGHLTRVTNYKYEYAEDAKAFRKLAREFDAEATK